MLMRTLTVRTLPMALLAGLLALAMQACVIVDSDGHDQGSSLEPDTTATQGQVEIIWALGGRTCTEAGIQTVEGQAD